MKFFKNKTDDFFRWVKGTELVELDDIDVSEDPVRPELTLGWRITKGRKIYGLKFEDDIEGIICIAYTNDVPHSVKELDMMSELVHMKKEKPTIAIAYTVWSRKRGAGRKIITALRDHINKERPDIQKMFTLSPLTPMATHFHIKNGARLVSINADTQNFQYKLKVENGEKRKD